jgi:hypothetical protein
MFANVNHLMRFLAILPDWTCLYPNAAALFGAILKKEDGCNKIEQLEALIHTFSRFIPEGVTQVFKIFLRGTHVLPKLISYEEHWNRLIKLERPSKNKRHFI